MKVLVIIGHQHKGSFCHAIAETTVDTLKASGHEVVYHDLYEEDFEAILSHEEVTDPTRLDPTSVEINRAIG